MARCPDCNGSGSPYDNSRLGSGRIAGAKCRGCGGTGKVPGTTRRVSNPCTNCSGTGRTMRLGGPNSSGSCYICNGTGKNPPAPKPARTTTNTTSSLAAELQKLALLHTVGALTAEEFRKAKAKLLGS
jgi:DnaJ-class molecular chaperone